MRFFVASIHSSYRTLGSPAFTRTITAALKGSPCMPQPQSLKNHARVDLLHHPAMLILVLNVLVAVIWAFVSHGPGLPLRLWLVIVSGALAVSSLKARMNPLRVQDRIIRLEEQLRYQTILSASQLAASQTLPLSSLIALRFAPDAELPILFDRVVKENLTPKQIKQAIAAWQPDLHRV